MIAFFITSGMPRRSPGLRLGNTLNIRYLFEHPRNNQSRLHIRHRKNRNIRLFPVPIKLVFNSSVIPLG